jgi:hypothetical protein
MDAVKLTTEIERVGGRARFVISAADSVSQDRLAHLGYPGVGDDRFATRWFADSARVSGYHEHFASSIRQMVLQSARLVPVPWEKALLEFLRRVDGSGLSWWLYGSAALAVRGIDVAPGDVDVTVSDAHLVGELMDDLLVGPIEELDGWVAKRIGRAFCGAIVEWLSEPYAANDVPGNPREQGPLVERLLETVEWRGYQLRVPPLTAQLATCERRRFTDRVALIRAAMRG